MTGDVLLIPKPALKEAEDRRLQALKDYHILDTIPEEDYDNLTLLARKICGTPIAIISLVDTHRQWFKSAQGTEVRETPLSVSFCNYAIATPHEVTMTTDARKDVRFNQNPLVNTEHGIVFYAGAPLVNQQGAAIGTICVMDHKPHELDAGQINALQALASQVMILLERRKENMQLRQLTETLKRSNNELKQAGHAISHDLKQPIFSIEGILKLLQADLEAGADMPDAKQMIDLALQSTSNFQVLLDDLLKYLQEGSMKQKKRRVSLDNCFKKAKASLNEQIKKTGASVLTENELPKIKGHSSELQRLFQNLISNSLKFRREDVDPQVVVCAHEHKNHWLLTLTDNGIGIRPVDAKKVFGVFKRLHSNAHYEGTGMGLALCKKIVLNHGGQIWLKSRPGSGTTFYIKLPKSIF